MRIYHVQVQHCEGWLAAHALEDDGVYTQGKTLEEVVENIRDVVDLRYGEKRVQIELVLPADFGNARHRLARPRRGRAGRARVASRAKPLSR